MKKTVLTAGLGVAALAAMPLLSTCALENSSIQRTDHLTVTIDKGCTFTAEAADGVDNAVILAQGQAIEGINGVEFDISCPSGVSGSHWELNAAGLNGDNTLSDGAGNSIASASGTLDGSSSNWAFKVETTGSAKFAGTYNQYSAVPKSSTKVAENQSPSEGASTVKAYYGVSAESEQAPGTYTGGVTYTLTSTGASD